MDISVRLKTSAVSYKGVVNINNQNGFYMNGRHMKDQQKDNVSISMESSSDQHLFAVYNRLDFSPKPDLPAMSITHELEKYHNKVNNSRLNVQGKLSRLNDMLNEFDNLVRSSVIGEHFEGDDMSFSGLIIHDDIAAAVNTQAEGIYLIREGSMKRLSSVAPSAEKRYRESIDNSESENNEDEKSDTYNSGLRERKTEIVELIEGDVIILCNRELVDMLQEDAIQEIAVRNEDPSMAASSLVNEAVSKGARDDVTALVIKVMEIKEDYEYDEDDVKGRKPNKFLHLHDKKQEVLRTFIAAALTCIILGGVIFTIYFVLNTTGDVDNKDISAAMTKTTTTKLPSGTSQQSTNSSTAASGTSSKNGSQSNQNASSGSKETNAPTSTVSGTSADARTYVVQNGDTLSKVSSKFYKSVDPKKIDLIKKANNLTGDNLKIGQKLIIP